MCYTFTYMDDQEKTIEQEIKEEGGQGNFNNKLASEAVRMFEDNARARQKRFDEIKKNEDMYFGVTTTALKGRSNIPFDTVVARGFVDTLNSNIRQDVSVKYGKTREQDYLAAEKIGAVLEREAGPDKGNWNKVFRDSKFLATFAGVGILKLVIKGKPTFSSDLMVVDHYDFVTEATGGSDIDKHLCKFQTNIFRSEDELNNAAGDYYDKGQVRKLILAFKDPKKRKEISDLYNQKQIRFASLGIDVATMGYIGSTMYRLTEGVVFYEGEWWYITYSQETKIWLRVEKLKDVFSHTEKYPGRGPWVCWHTHPHPSLFWTPAPMDDIRPIAYTMKKLVNISIDNLEKRGWDMKAYDPKVFPDPSQLLYRQDGLVRARLKPGQDISTGIYTFQTPDTTAVTINMIEWMNNFAGQKTGVTPDSQGAAQTDRVGILVSNLDQVSKRLMLTNDRFKDATIALGAIFDYGCYDHLREEYAVKIIGEKGAQWEEDVTLQDMSRDFSITVRDAAEEERKDVITGQRKEAALAKLAADPELRTALNKKELIRITLQNGGFKEEEINILLDSNYDGGIESRARAAQAIQDVLEGKELTKLYRGATTAFVEKILDFCSDNFDLLTKEQYNKLSPGKQKKYDADMKKHDVLLKYANDHLPIAQKNAERKMVQQIAAAGGISADQGQMSPGNASEAPQPEMSPTPSPEVMQPKVAQPM